MYALDSFFSYTWVTHSSYPDTNIYQVSLDQFHWISRSGYFPRHHLHKCVYIYESFIKFLVTLTRNASHKQFHLKTRQEKNTYSKKYILGSIKACSIDTCCVGRVAFTHHPAGKAGDGALSDGCFFTVPSAWNGVSHHKVNRALRRSSNLTYKRKM